MKKLYRSRDDRVLAGVCGGIAKYLGVDSTIVRIIAFLLIVPGGLSIWVYIALAIIIPNEPYGRIEDSYGEKYSDPFKDSYDNYREEFQRQKNNKDEDFY
ncbi:DNA-binding transcriptional activator PspC [Peptoniphilus harei]|uniref:PspC domain-containing protein n=1 Tax=Peptoniphilus harei TaxID=54005 RepID=UPI000F6BD759|nr:PspC domain-containing protein [Peptoniphilus harei]MDU1177319.1 PspC domain-containing protein [Peptoniphilus harei]MDU5471117.1 PspC domain-containing protein [Peptoniphilus harei]MDU6098942.1 PspC domain-containing protein [Peptoniphilus harei]QQE46335.1 PspC domain-containing protein [Peptoniphilus harei]VEJ33479.1 DNA-binding transcriptional activator PspC [Peptoniphilus harei]